MWNVRFHHSVFFCICFLDIGRWVQARNTDAIKNGTDRINVVYHNYDGRMRCYQFLCNVNDWGHYVNVFEASNVGEE